MCSKNIWKDYSDRVKKIWNDPKNRLDSKNYKTHNGKKYNNVSSRDYEKAVRNKLNDFLKGKGKKCINDLTDKELQDFADDIKNTTDGDIGAYNQGVADEIAAADAEAAEAEEALEAIDIAVDVDEAAIITGEALK